MVVLVLVVVVLLLLLLVVVVTAVATGRARDGGVTVWKIDDDSRLLEERGAP